MISITNNSKSGFFACNTAIQSNYNKLDYSLIISKFVGICGSDKQKYKNDNSINYLGHEIVGINPLDFQPVCVNPNISCNECIYCLNGNFNLCENEKSIGTNIEGALQGYLLVPNKNIVKINDLSYKYVLSDPLAVVLHGLNMASFETSSNVLIIGSGMISKLLVWCLNRKNIIPTVMVRSNNYEFFSDLKIKKILTMGENFNHHEYNTVFECVGFKQQQSLNFALKAVTKAGNIFVFGVFPNDFYSKMIVRKLFENEVTIRGVRSFNPQDFIDSIELIKENGKIFDNFNFSINTTNEVAKVNKLIEKRNKIDKIVIKF